jgi:hypothetical protein
MNASPASVPAGGQNDDRSQSKSFHIIFEPSTPFAVVVLTAAVGAAVAGSVTCHVAGGCGQDPAKLSLTGVYLGQAVVAILAVFAISGEYGTGMIRLTFAAMHRRVGVLAAKAAVVTGLVLAAGTVAAVGSVLAGQLILPATAWPARRCRWGTAPTCARPSAPRCT